MKKCNINQPLEKAHHLIHEASYYLLNKDVSKCDELLTIIDHMLHELIEHKNLTEK